MTQRFKAVAGFLAAATLLSGSAFGFAPEFDQDLPTVIITDSIPGFDSPAYDVNGVPSATTEYVFRYTHAFALQDYVSDLRGNTFNLTKFAFNEFDSDTDDTPNQVKTLLINGQQAYAQGTDTIPTAADVDASGALITNRYADGGLDFRNRDLSGDDENVNSGFDAIGNVTGIDIRTTDQQRVVQLYLKGNTSDDLVVRNFVVITTIDGNDRLGSAVATYPWVNVFEQTELEGWTNGGLGSLAGIPIPSGSDFVFYNDGDNDISGYTFTPASGPTGASQATVALSSNATEFGFGTWANENTTWKATALEANALYRLRANIYSTNAASNEIVRFSLGSQFGPGLSTVAFNTPSNQTFNYAELPQDTTNESVAYLLAESASVLDPVISAEIVTFGLGGADYTISSIKVEKAEAGLASLGTGTVLFNQGAASFTDGDPVVDPVASPTGFVTTAGTAGSSWAFANANSSNAAVSSRTSSQLKITFPQSNGVAAPTFALFGLENANTVEPWLGGAFQVAKGKVYQLDVWASTDTPQTVAGSVPDMRIDVVQQMNQAAFLTHVLDPLIGTDAIPSKITTTPRAYSLIWEPNGDAATAEATLNITFLSLGDTYPSPSSVIIHRVTLTEYEAPGRQ